MEFAPPFSTNVLDYMIRNGITEPTIANLEAAMVATGYGATSGGWLGNVAPALLQTAALVGAIYVAAPLIMGEAAAVTVASEVAGAATAADIAASQAVIASMSGAGVGFTDAALASVAASSAGVLKPGILPTTPGNGGSP